MKDPDQIDKLIYEDIASQHVILRRLDREKTFHEKRVEQLTKLLTCEHEPERMDKHRDRCRLCNYSWIR